MGSSNMIRKFRNGLELKGKVAYFDDYTREYGKTQTRMYLSGHTVTVSELVNNTSHTNDLRGGFSLTRNERKGYIKNNTLFGRQWNNDRGFIQRNDSSDIFQGKRFKGINFSNDFSAIVVRGKQLVTFQSKVGYFENPQQLSVTPGPFDSVLNEGKPYDKALQTVFYKNLDLDHSISMVKGYKRLSLVPRVGFRYAQQQMESGLATITSSVERELGAPFQNGITLYVCFYSVLINTIQL